MHLLNGLPPGNIVVAMFALQAASKLAVLHGNPITRKQAEDWLAASYAQEEDYHNTVWVNWSLDNMEYLA
jgi:hypothetical protein